MTVVTFDNNPRSRAAKELEKFLMDDFMYDVINRRWMPEHKIIRPISDEGVSATACFLLSMLLFLADPDTLRISVSRKRLATELRLKSASSVDRYIKELEAAGLLHKEHRFGTGANHSANLYTVGLVYCPERIWGC